MYYIQNKNAGYLGNAIYFWALNRNGYTADINKAEIFNHEEAKSICQGNPEKNIAWSVEYIKKNEGNQLVTDSQHLDKKYIKTF